MEPEAPTDTVRLVMIRFSDNSLKAASGILFSQTQRCCRVFSRVVFQAAQTKCLSLLRWRQTSQKPRANKSKAWVPSWTVCRDLRL